MDFERVAGLTEEIIGTGAVAGVVVAAGRAGTVVSEIARGSSSPSTIFDAGSMTQSLATSTIIASLTAANGINLNTPVVRYWPEFAEEGKEKVTLRHLLKHTSGLPAGRPYFSDLTERHPEWLGTEKGKEFVLSMLAAEPLEYPPTYTLIQSNLGYMALGYIAEIIGGPPLSELFDRIVARPLGLEDASFGLPEGKKSRCAVSATCPHRHRILCGEVLDMNAFAMGGFAGHAGLFITAADAIRIGMALVRSLKQEGGLLPGAAITEFIGPKAKYKMGWEMPDRVSPLCGSRFSGNTIGHVSKSGSSLWIDVEDETAVAVFCAFSGGEKQSMEISSGRFTATLPAIHDEIRMGLQPEGGGPDETL